MTAMTLNMKIDRPHVSPLENKPIRQDPSDRRKRADDDFAKSMTQQSKAVSVNEPPRNEPLPTNDEIVRDPAYKPSPKEPHPAPEANVPDEQTDVEAKASETETEAVFQLVPGSDTVPVKTTETMIGQANVSVPLTQKVPVQEIDAQLLGKPVTQTAENSEPSSTHANKDQAVTLQSQPPPVPSAQSSPAVPSGLVEINQPRKHIDKTLTNISNPVLTDNALLQTPSALANTASFTPIQSFPTPPAWQSALLNPGLIMDQVKIQLLTGAKTGEKRISVQMQPPELGKLNIELSLNDKQIDARIYTEHQAVREVVLSQIEQLRSQLSQEGWTLGKVDVNIGTFREQQDQKTSEGTSFGRFGRGGQVLSDTLAVSEATIREWRPPGIGARINMIV